MNTAVVLGAAKGIVEKTDRILLSENNGPKTWAAFLLHRMGYVKRRGTPAELELLKSNFLEEIATTVEMKEISPSLVINWVRPASTSSLSRHGQWRKKE